MFLKARELVELALASHITMHFEAKPVWNSFQRNIQAWLGFTGLPFFLVFCFSAA